MQNSGNNEIYVSKKFYLFCVLHLFFQVVRNLVYLSRVISALNESPKNEDDVEVTLSWMIRKMCREAKKEVAETPNISMRVNITHDILF